LKNRPALTHFPKVALQLWMKPLTKYRLITGDRVFFPTRVAITNRHHLPEKICPVHV